MTRRATLLGTTLLVAGLLAFDLAASAPLDPFAAPPLLALGSGQAATGALCTALPTAE